MNVSNFSHFCTLPLNIVESLGGGVANGALQTCTRILKRHLPFLRNFFGRGWLGQDPPPSGSTDCLKIGICFNRRVLDNNKTLDTRFTGNNEQLQIN